jgi:hypothetical protein
MDDIKMYLYVLAVGALAAFLMIASANKFDQQLTDYF